MSDLFPSWFRRGPGGGRIGYGVALASVARNWFCRADSRQLTACCRGASRSALAERYVMGDASGSRTAPTNACVIVAHHGSRGKKEERHHQPAKRAEGRSPRREPWENRPPPRLSPVRGERNHGQRQRRNSIFLGLPHKGGDVKSPQGLVLPPLRGWGNFVAPRYPPSRPRAR